MKKISEMTLEELQDYALNQESTIRSKDDELKSKDSKIQELTDLTVNLQKRNNDLFMKVEAQKNTPDGNITPAGEKEVQSCEDFAKSLIK